MNQYYLPFNNDPLVDDYVATKHMKKKAENPLDDDYGFFRDAVEVAEDPLSDDYIKEEYR